MREFGFGAKRALEPYRSPDDRTYQDPNVSPYFRLNQLSAADRNNIGYSDYARQQDNLVLREGQINDQMAAQRQKLQQDKRKVARLEQVQDTEDQANEALAAGVPVSQVIQKFPGLAQSPSFGNYMQQVRAVAPAQQTLAPHYRKMLKSPEERADFDQAFQHFGNVTQADDHARAKAAERAHRVSLIEAGIPLESIEKAGPLNAERAALLKQQHKVSLTGGDPRAEKVFETFNKMVEAGDTKGAEAYRDYMRESQGIDIAPKPVVVAPAAAPAADVPALVQAGVTTGPAVQSIAPKTNGEPISEIDSLGASVADPKAPIENKRAAFDKMVEVAAAAKPPKFSNLTEVAKFREGIKKKLDDAQFELDTHHLKGQWADAWAKRKNDMGEAISEMSRDLGIDEDVILGSLATKPPEDGSIPEPQVVPASIIPNEMQSSDPRERATGKRYIKDLLASYVARQNGRNPSEANYQNELQGRADDDLSHWEGNHVRGFNETEKKGLARMGAVGQFTQEDVLKRFINDRLLQVPTPVTAKTVQAPASEKIVIGTPKKKP